MEPMIPLKAPPVELDAILALEATLVLPHFNDNDALRIGTTLHQRVRNEYPKRSVAINITHANCDTLLYHSVTSPSPPDPALCVFGITPDHDEWIRRKRNTVKRFGTSSWFIGRKYNGDQEAFMKKLMLNPGVSGKSGGLGLSGGDYAIHGGGVPIRVESVSGVVGVLVVSGLKQEEDHMLAVEALLQFIEEDKAVRIK